MTKCKHKVEIEKCQYGRLGGQTIYCQFGNSLRVWKEHLERRSDSPMKPKPDECEHPELYGIDLKKGKKPYKAQTPKLPGPSFAVIWPNGYNKEIEVSQTRKKD